MRKWSRLLAGVLIFYPVMAWAQKPPLPENLALQAAVAADSEYSAQYAARHAIDGQIPLGGSQADVAKAWCVQGRTHRDGAALTLTWKEPVIVAEVVYYGRTAWFAEECWKDYQLLADDGAEPVASGTLEMGDGPQRIALRTPRQLTRLTLKFTSSYGGPNPGASEIQVFSTPAPQAALPAFRKLSPGRPEIVEDFGEESAELADALRQGRLGFRELVLIQRHPIDSSHVYTYHVEGFRPGGGLFIYNVDGRLRRLVDAGGGQILDCDLSHDARQILFSWRKAEDQGYHVYVVNADGTGLRQLTDGEWHDYNACWLPDGGIAFLSTRLPQFAYCWISPVGLLHRMERDGSNVRRLSANIVNDFTPAVMEDGRIMYSRWEYVDKPAIPIQSLWTIHPDGTMLEGFYGNRVLSPATFMNARQIPGSGRVLCILTSHNGPARGAVGIIDRSLGDNAQQALTNLTPEIDVGRVDKGNGNHIRGAYETPFPLDGQYYLVARGGSVLVRDYAGREQAVVIRPRDGMWFCNPLPLRPTAPPPVIASRIAEAAPDERWATLVLVDVYAGLEPHVKRGEVRQIAVVQEMEKSIRVDLNNRAFDFQFPVISCGATYAGKKVWGYARVEEDGSACFKVPANVPIYFMALDGQGRAVQRMRTFTHLMGGEVQGCVGCHEPRSSAAHHRQPVASLASPQDLAPPSWGAGAGFDYSSIVQPIWDRHCVSCHGGVEAAGNVDLSGDKTDYFNVSYEWLARGRKGNDWVQWDSPYVNWIPTYNGHEQNILQITPGAWGSPRSRLADLVLNGHPDQKGAARVNLSEDERRRVFTWIDLNIPYYGTSEAVYPDAQGCRRILPADLDKTLAEVAKRRCAACHFEGKVPRPVWTRITNPQLNSFLTAPLARAAGGTQRCGQAVFADTHDADYQAILRTFDPVLAMLREKPRDDMPGAKPATDVCRIRK